MSITERRGGLRFPDLLLYRGYSAPSRIEADVYDLEIDPGKLHNLVADPASRGEPVRLRERLVAWMEATNDRLLNQWTRPQLLEGLTI